MPKDKPEDIKLYDKVRILATGQLAFVVDIDDEVDSYILEIDVSNDDELEDRVHFYKRSDFEKI